MNKSSNSPQLDQVFSALAHPKRRGMVLELAFRPATVGQLARDHDLTLPAMHKHVRALEESGLVLRKKAGRTNYLALSKQTLREAQSWLGQFHAEWGNDEETLENYIAHLKD